MDKKLLRTKMRGCLVGGAVGETLGMPVEGMNQRQIARVHGRVTEMMPARQAAGEWTDDTQLMVPLAECIGANGRVDQNDLARRFMEAYEPWRGYGAVFRNWHFLMELGRNWKQAAEEVHDPFSGTWNGSVMRVAPVGAFFFDDTALLIEQARLSGEVTHVDEIAQQGCVLLALAVGLAMRAKDPGAFDGTAFLAELRRRISHPLLVERLRRVGELLEGDDDPDEVIRRIGHRVEVQNSVPTAIYCFLRSPGNFEEAVIRAVNMGGDADSLGIMCGAIGGALHGESAIPERWSSVLEAKDRILAAADRLWERHAGS
jgi:ADP-ribosylglycohydrolase